MAGTFKDIINEIARNVFFPLEDNQANLPDAPGVYVVCAYSLEVLPEIMGSLEYQYLNGYPVIYTGIAGRPTSKKKSLRNRDYKNHFNGNARGSTLRKSLGVLMKLRKRQSPGELGTTKYRFIPEDERFLSTWMKNNLILHFAQTNSPTLVEQSLIDYFTPPLNLKDNNSDTNIEFRNSLSKLRKTVD